MRRALLLLFCTLMATAAAEDAAGNIVAHVAETPVHQEELALHLARHRALVAVHFREKHGIALDDETAWRKRVDGEVPAELLQQRAMESCLRDKAIQVLAVKHGVGRVLPFPGFANYVEAANHLRAATAEQGGRIHGPVRLGAWQFYRYKVDNMRLRLIHTLQPDDAATGKDHKLEAAIRDLLAGGVVRSPAREQQRNGGDSAVASQETSESSQKRSGISRSHFSTGGSSP